MIRDLLSQFIRWLCKKINHWGDRFLIVLALSGFLIGFVFVTSYEQWQDIVRLLMPISISTLAIIAVFVIFYLERNMTKRQQRLDMIRYETLYSPVTSSTEEAVSLMHREEIAENNEMLKSLLGKMRELLPNEKQIDDVSILFYRHLLSVRKNEYLQRATKLPDILKYYPNETKADSDEQKLREKLFLPVTGIILTTLMTLLLFGATLLPSLTIPFSSSIRSGLLDATIFLFSGSIFLFSIFLFSLLNSVKNEGDLTSIINEEVNRVKKMHEDAQIEYEDIASKVKAMDSDFDETLPTKKDDMCRQN